MDRLRESVRALNIGDLFSRKLLFYFFKVSGVAPMNLDVTILRNTNVKQYAFKYSHANIVYNTFLIIGMIALNCFAVYGYFYAENRKNEPIYYATDTLGFLGVIVILITFSYNSKKQIILCNKISDINSRLKHNQNLFKTDFFNKINIAILMYTINWIGLTISVALYNFRYTIFFLSLNACHFVITLVALQYCIAVEILKRLFIKLNENLRNHQKYIDSAYGFVSIARIDEELSRLWDLYAELNKLSREISSFYSMSMIIITVNAFATPTTVIYAIIAKPLAMGSTDLVFNDYVSGILFTFLYLCSIVLLTSSIAATTNESKKTRDIISLHLRNSESREIMEKLHRISIYLLYEVVEFTVFDCFSLNGSLLVSIVGTAATYLVILLQFQGKHCGAGKNSTYYSYLDFLNQSYNQIAHHH